MARPLRNSDPKHILGPTRTFFVTTKTSMGQRLFQSERNSMLLVDVMRSCVASKKFLIHDFVVMPDHIHLLVTVHDDMTIEKAMQLIKGTFSYRLKHEHNYLGEVWQRGFSESRAYDAQAIASYREYIAQNPLKAGLAHAIGEYPYCYCYLASKKMSRL
jgi:putative transposase